MSLPLTPYRYYSTLSVVGPFTESVYYPAFSSYVCCENRKTTSRYTLNPTPGVFNRDFRLHELDGDARDEGGIPYL